MSNSINKIGIMNGRLSEPLGTKIQEFPSTTWKDEFVKASDYAMFIGGDGKQKTK